MTEIHQRSPVSALAPEPDADSADFWQALRGGELMVPCCGVGHRFFPPMPACPECGDPRIALVPAGGRARVYSWAVVHVALHPSFAPDTPYTVVVAELEEGGRLMGRLLGADQTLHADAELRFELYEVDGVVLPGFRLNPATKTHLEDAALVVSAASSQASE